MKNLLKWSLFTAVAFFLAGIMAEFVIGDTPQFWIYGFCYSAGYIGMTACPWIASDLRSDIHRWTS
jgi:hypothetical protein